MLAPDIRSWIESACAPGLAPRHARQSQPEPAPRAVGVDGVQRILRTRWKMPALAPDQAGQRVTVEQDRGFEDLRGNGHGRSHSAVGAEFEHRRGCQRPLAPVLHGGEGWGKGRPLAPHSLQQRWSLPPPLTERVALASQRSAARRGLHSPREEAWGVESARITRRASRPSCAQSTSHSPWSDSYPRPDRRRARPGCACRFPDRSRAWRCD